MLPIIYVSRSSAYFCLSLQVPPALNAGIPQSPILLRLAALVIIVSHVRNQKTTGPAWLAAVRAMETRGIRKVRMCSIIPQGCIDTVFSHCTAGRPLIKLRYYCDVAIYCL
jgi:hypothetical protein